MRIFNAFCLRVFSCFPSSHAHALFFLGRQRNARIVKHFGAYSEDTAVMQGQLDLDGFPPVGLHIVEGDPLYG
jgi:hypothetical protein